MPPPPERRPVAVRFRREIQLPHTSPVAPHLPGAVGDWNQLFAQFPGIEIVPYYEGFDLNRLIELQNVAPVLGPRPFAFTSCYRIWCPPGTDREKLAAVLRVWPGVESAYAEGVPSLPSVTPDPDTYNQSYVNAATNGIGAQAVWGLTDGAGVGFVDLECGWQLSHVEFPAGIATLWGDHSTDLKDIRHGTSVLGIVSSKDDGSGIVGIAPAATTRLVSHLRAGSYFHIARAILEASSRMNSGDVLLLEVQVARLVLPFDYLLGLNETNFPAEIDDNVFEQVLNAVSRGIVVVAAAGNGYRDLDLQENELGQKIFLNSVRDSGAILVAAGTPPTYPVPRARLDISNYGSRIDCFAHGDAVYTCGYSSASVTNHYNPSFKGTSAAAAIVAGAALLLQSWKKARGAPYSPLELRAKLADRTPNINTASAHGHPVDRIGVMPNLAKLIPGAAPTPAHLGSDWATMVRILAGVLNDGGGVIWKPGKGPIPVDPWGPLLAKLDPAERDLVVGLAALDLARHASRKSASKRLAKAARRILKDARKSPKRDR